MADSDIEINLELIDNASSQLAEASSNISNSLDMVSNSSSQLASAAESTVPPLSESEQAQMQLASAAVELKDAQTTLTSATENLNATIRQNGSDSEEAAVALRDFTVAQQNVKDSQSEFNSITKQSSGSLKGFALGASGAATAGFSLYNSFDRIEKAELAVDRANLQVRTSTKGVEDAQRNLNAAVVEHGTNSAEAKAASEQLSIAQERLEVANERARQSQDNVNQAMMASAIQIIPSAITMVDSLGRAWKNFPDMTGVLKTLGTNVSDVGSKATLAAIGVGSFVGGFTLGYTVIKQFGDALGPVGRALMVVVPAIIAAAAAVWMLQEGLTLGVATVALVAAGIAVGAMVANLESYGNVAGLASGGVVDHPMLALIGEGGEKEIVMPLSQYEAQRATDKEFSQSGPVSQPQPNVIYVTLTQQFYGDINSPEYVDMAAEKTINQLDEKLRHSRSG